MNLLTNSSNKWNGNEKKKQTWKTGRLKSHKSNKNEKGNNDHSEWERTVNSNKQAVIERAFIISRYIPIL